MIQPFRVVAAAVVAVVAAESLEVSAVVSAESVSVAWRYSPHPKDNFPASGAPQEPASAARSNSLAAMRWMCQLLQGLVDVAYDSCGYERVLLAPQPCKQRVPGL